MFHSSAWSSSLPPSISFPAMSVHIIVSNFSIFLPLLASLSSPTLHFAPSFVPFLHFTPFHSHFTSSLASTLPCLPPLFCSQAVSPLSFPSLSLPLTNSLSHSHLPSLSLYLPSLSLSNWLPSLLPSPSISQRIRPTLC
jgi:hypothetical protein